MPSSWQRLFVTEFVFVGYLHGTWYRGNYWETEYFKKATFTERWEYWIGWRMGRAKRIRIYS